MKRVKKLENQSSPFLLADQNNVFLIDWITVVFHNASVSLIQSLLGLSDPHVPWETEVAFRNGYPCRTSYKHINIHWGADDERFYKSDEKKSASEKVRTDMGICLDISGQGCREFENIQGNDWLKFLHDICDRDFRTTITRLDLAYDDHIGTLDLYRIAADVRDRNYTSPSKKSQIIWSDDQINDVNGLTVYVGSKSSDILIRLYDKAAEREFGPERHWVRCEIQLRHSRCIAAVAEILKQQHVGRTASGILRNYLLFREPNGTDENKSRWPVAPYWDRVLLDMERVRLWISPGEPYNFSKTELHLIKQYGQALLTVKEINGEIGTLLEECKRRYPVLNEKYRKAIDFLRHDRKAAPQEEPEPQYDHRAWIDLDGRYAEFWYAEQLFGDDNNGRNDYPAGGSNFPDYRNDYPGNYRAGDNWSGSDGAGYGISGNF